MWSAHLLFCQEQPPALRWQKGVMSRASTALGEEGVNRMKSFAKIACLTAAMAFSAVAFAQGSPTHGPIANDGLTGAKLPSIPIGNHYVCYPVKPTTDFKPRWAVFNDQFGSWKIYVLGINALCAPAEKTIDGKRYPIENKELHLTCYKIRYEGQNPHTVITNDQFGPQKLTFLPAKEVCLPAGKLVLK
jgi:hypothetical protein